MLICMYIAMYIYTRYYNKDEPLPNFRGVSYINAPLFYYVGHPCLMFTASGVGALIIDARKLM